MRNLLLTVVALSSVACGNLESFEAGPVEQDVQEVSRLTPEQADFALFAANTLDFDTLDAELDVRAVRGIVQARPFDTLEALDAVSYVGARALDALAELGAAHFEDVPYNHEIIPDDTLILWAANTLDFTTLDDTVGLDRRAAQGIVDARPFASVEALDEAYYVGANAMQRLRDHAAGVFGETCERNTLLSADGTPHYFLTDALDGATARVDLIACRGYVPSGGFSTIDQDVDVAIYGFGMNDSEIDGGYADGFIDAGYTRSTFSFYGIWFHSGNDLFSTLDLFSSDVDLLAARIGLNTATYGSVLQALDVLAIDSELEANTGSYGAAVSAFSVTLVDTDLRWNTSTAGAALQAFELDMVGGEVEGNEGAAAIEIYTHSAQAEASAFTDVAFIDGGAYDGASLLLDHDGSEAQVFFDGLTSAVCDASGCN